MKDNVEVFTMSKLYFYIGFPELYLLLYRNEEWLCTLDVLQTFTEHLNKVNLKLQRKEQNICQPNNHNEAFKK